MSVGADIYGRPGQAVMVEREARVQDREVAVRAVVALAMWIVGVGLVVANIFVKPSIGELGLTSVAGAVVMNVRGYFCRFHEQVRNGFELGRDYERGHAQVHQLR